MGKIRENWSRAPHFAGESDKRLKAIQSQVSSQKTKIQQLQTELQEARRTPAATDSTAANDLELLRKENAALKEKVRTLSV